MLQVQVLPLNASSGMRIVGDGTFQQTFNRDDGNYYPSYSSVKPLVVTMDVAVQDPDGVMPNGNVQLDRIDWYLGEYTPSKKISAGNANYEMAMQSNQPVLLIKKNTTVSDPFYLIGEAFYTNVKTGKQESRIEQKLLSSIFYEAGNFTLVPKSPTEIIVDPTKIDESSPTNWHVTLSVTLKSGLQDVPVGLKRVFYWYVKENEVERLITTSDAWVVSGVNNNTEYKYGSSIVVNASKITNLKIVARVAYRAPGYPFPTSPYDPSLFVNFNIRVELPRLQDINNIPVSGQYISPLSLANNALIKQKCEIVAGGTVIDNPAKYYNITWKSRSKKDGEKIVGYGEDIAAGSKDIGLSVTNGVELFPEVQPKIGSWNVEGSIYNGIDANPVFQYGTNEIANQLGAYLIKCEDGVNVEIVGKLANNNWNRFEDGSLAPTMVNTPDEDKGYNIMYGWTKTIHTIDNAPVGDEYAVLFSEQPFEYNGVQSRPIPPTLICPGLPTLKDGKFRSIYFKFNAIPGSNGLLGITEFNKTDRSYPKHGISQLVTNTGAVANNADKNKTIPFAPLMDWHLLNITNALMNKFGTVALHQENMFGLGISSSTAVSVSNYLTSTSIRYNKISEPTNYKYQKLSETPEFCVDDSGTKKSWDVILNNMAAKMATLETQMALSYATENNVQPGTTFNFGSDNWNYYYYNIPGFKTLLEGEMNAKLIKRISLSGIQAFDTNGNPENYNIFITLQSSCVYGMDLLSGDINMCTGAGMERVVTIVDETLGINPNNIIKNYLCTDQEKLTLSTLSNIPSDQNFDFETSANYLMVGESSQINGYFINPFRGTRIGSVLGGSSYQKSGYKYDYNQTNGRVGDKIRLSLRTRGYGSTSVLSALISYNFHSVNGASTTMVGGFQVRLPEPTINNN